MLTNVTVKYQHTTLRACHNDYGIRTDLPMQTEPTYGTITAESVNYLGYW